MQEFTYTASPMRVVFGAGTIKRLPDELERLGITRALVLATPRQQAELGDLASLTGLRMAGVFGGATVHTPLAVTERAMQAVDELKPDGIVAIGAGAATGSGKGVLLSTRTLSVVVTSACNRSSISCSPMVRMGCSR